MNPTSATTARIQGSLASQAREKYPDGGLRHFVSSFDHFPHLVVLIASRTVYISSNEACVRRAFPPVEYFAQLEMPPVVLICLMETMKLHGSGHVSLNSQNFPYQVSGFPRWMKQPFGVNEAIVFFLFYVLLLSILGNVSRKPPDVSKTKLEISKAF